MGKQLKVLMLGGQRTGKSSALAAIMDSFLHGKASEILTIKDKTVLAKQEGVKQKSIASRLKDTRTFLQKNAGKVVMADSGKTDFIWHYQLKLDVPGSTDSLSIIFTDVNGEFYTNADPRQETVMKLIPEYDVFIVTVDTTFLMEALNPDAEFITPSINDKYNCRGQIHTFLTQINDRNGQDAKMVIFVPIKCEKWARQNELSEVVDAVKDFYSVTLKHLAKYKSVQIEMLPIQTLGTAIFKEHLEPYVFHWKETRFLFFERERQSKCSMLDDGTLRLATGDIMDPKKGSVEPDGDAFLIDDNPDFIKPNSWFLFESDKYHPHNCEQLAYHILEFMLLKAIDAKIRDEENENPVKKYFKKAANFIMNVCTFCLYDQLVNIFGSISIEKMQVIIGSFHEQKLIKYYGEGIEITKACIFKTNKK